MSSVRKLQPQQTQWPQDREEYYQTLTTRNFHFVSSDTQKRLRDIKILIAGCGSTGGACIEPLARLGVENFILADNGEYELTNLNRQHAFKENIGQNKAQFHADNLTGINPFVNVKYFTEGLSIENIDSTIQWADIIIDAIDVTSASGIAMKLQLHERAQREHKAVLTALDIGFRQWGRSYDYRNEHLDVFDGAYDAAKAAKHPLKVLFSFVPLSAVPAHSLNLLEDLLTKRDVSASQLGCTSDLLSAIIVPVILRFVESGEVVDGWDIDLNPLAKPFKARMQESFRAFFARRRIKRLLDQTL
ncbi:ThiF family adenylyltransferase [Bdellovibrio sp. HCB337]|uniref:ThiF family adenylyltransferase n=1 Tax=Bdellovibrio sp. HCB337 TaxID=3394358 RepID=UPI0039A41C31